MAIDKRVQAMMEGDKNAIIDGFVGKSCVLCVNAIIQAVQHGMRDRAVEVQLERLKADDTCLFGHNAGYRVSDFAQAALHLLDFSEYNGSDENIIALIRSGLLF